MWGEKGHRILAEKTHRSPASLNLTIIRFNVTDTEPAESSSDQQNPITYDTSTLFLC
jgi:hypothetical protein